MSSENLSLWGRGLLPPAPTASQLRAALLILSTPLKAEVPPEIDFRIGPMHPDYGAPNPEHEKWIDDFLQKVRALCTWNTIKTTESGTVDWMALAIHLIREYKPKNKSEPRIKLKRKAGAKLKRSTPEAKADRRDLLQLVESELASNRSLSVSGFASDLATKEKWQRKLPARFQGKSDETLRKQIALAQKDVEYDAMLERTAMSFAELFRNNPAPRTGTGDGLRFRPSKVPGKKSDSNS